MKINNYRLEDLNIEIRTEVELNENFILPLFFKSSELTQDDINISYGYFAKDKVEQTQKREKPIDFKKIVLKNDGNVELHNFLKLQDYFAEEEEKKYINFVFKFVDLDLLNKTVSQNVYFDNVLELYDYLGEMGFLSTHFNHIFYVVAQYVKMLHIKINNICLQIFRVEKRYEKEEEYTMEMFELQASYEDLHIPYFPENINKSLSSWSYRERETLRCYKTKKNMIDNAIRKRIEREAKMGGK